MSYENTQDPAVMQRRVDQLDAIAQKSLQSAEVLIKKMGKGKRCCAATMLTILIRAAQSNEKEAKKLAKRVVSAASQVVDVVEGVAEIHPIAKVSSDET